MTTSAVPAATVEEAFEGFHEEVSSRLQAVANDAARGGLDRAIDLVVASIRAGGVLQAFGTGHSQAFAMEIAGRAGGFIPTTMMALRDVVLHGSRDASVLTGSA
ncbi:MAG: SIS domain-containing protein, partial [Lapillicoccus sp.]